MGGVSNTGGADGAYVMGHNNEVSSTARYSAIFGKGLKATDEDTIVLGTYNKVQQGTGRMVVIGNGTSDTARKNAVEIMRDGRVKLFRAPEEDNDAVRLLELHSKQDVIYGAQAQALNSTITKAKVDKYDGYETKINSNTSEINTLMGKPGLDKVGTVTKVNGTSPDSSGNVTITIPDAYTKTEADGKYVPYTGASKDVNLGNHSLSISDKTSISKIAIKVSGRYNSEDDTSIAISPHVIKLTGTGSVKATLTTGNLMIASDDGHRASVSTGGFQAQFMTDPDGDGQADIYYSIYGYDGIMHNGNKLSLPEKQGTIALTSDLPTTQQWTLTSTSGTVTTVNVCVK